MAWAGVISFFSFSFALGVYGNRARSQIIADGQAWVLVNFFLLDLRYIFPCMMKAGRCVRYFGL